MQTPVTQGAGQGVLPRPRSSVAVLGAGPAGLTAAWYLSRHGVDVEVHEADPDRVGGISRTEEYKGFRFDIGGHRFFTKAPDVEQVWREILPPDQWLRVRRVSRIHYRGRFFDYPLRAHDAFAKLGPVTSLLCLVSYLRARMAPRRRVATFEDWVVNNFGWRLYSIFFKTYTEKVWGRPCTEISADWAAQRIKGLSLLTAVQNALPGMPRRRGSAVIKTLIDEFDYPREGPGQMWEHAATAVRAVGGTVDLGSRAVAVRHDGGRVTAVDVEAWGTRRSVTADHYVSTIPMRELVEAMDPPAPAAVRAAAAGLHYRDYLTVVLVVDRRDVFPDNWIYVHSPEVEMGRVQNYKNWSPDMVPDTAQTALGLEYFTNEDDPHLWHMTDDELIDLGIAEIAQLGLVSPSEVVDATVVRVRKAYPVYDEHYVRNVAVVRDWLARAAANLQTVGRNGMHKYNNQDHSMKSALLAARNLLGEDWDPWKVNTDALYHEEVVEGGDEAGRLVPRPVSAPAAGGR